MGRKGGHGGRSDEESERTKKLLKNEKKIAKGRIIGLVGPCFSFFTTLSLFLSLLICFFLCFFVFLSLFSFLSPFLPFYFLENWEWFWGSRFNGNRFAANRSPVCSSVNR